MRPFTTSAHQSILKIWKGMEALPWYNNQIEAIINKHPTLSKKATAVEVKGRPHESDKDPMHLTIEVKDGEDQRKHLTTMHVYADASVYIVNKDYREPWEKQQRALEEKAAVDTSKTDEKDKDKDG